MASCFHATCDEEAEDIRAYGLSVPIAVIPNGVDLPQWEKKPHRPMRRRVISLGRIHPKKGIDRLVSAWAQIETVYPDWELYIVGPSENNHAAELATQAEMLGLRRCIISDPVFGSKKDELLRAADIFILPTLSENFALTVAESLAVGTSVISTKGAPWQGLEDNRCGWWIDHGVEPLAAALRHAMALPQNELNLMGERGRAWMERDFAWDAIALQMLEVYQWLAGKGDRPQCVRID